MLLSWLSFLPDVQGPGCRVSLVRNITEGPVETANVCHALSNKGKCYLKLNTAVQYFSGIRSFRIRLCVTDDKRISQDDKKEHLV